ncbi:putative ML domain, phosphatidylinositol/phosphatidylglycerol transfer protein [Medicago truncatula]|uniref:MD-like lipid recognition domain protein/ML domain protein n=1 Tax=Medicago truncatula TaxID=3880 RepID=A0A072VUX7_MEDTR|nr:putative phosphatidylglycerol/phosphatidylinositol transfer protein DDB_G0282179 isoform X1 [Medicago truncatula]KEH41865.1 MD-like lipid recognition domain protein/ML domain protein [Medicago truncatula]RHN79399.1 putative ML domain, phosphatidylinositol/phosphatidylglycerol transfer protein [Medicago truncatula]
MEKIITSKLFFFFFFSTLFLLQAFTDATDVHYCGKKDSYDVQVKGVQISPDPVARGQPATFTISANTSQALSEGKLVVDVSYFGWHVYSETHDLCGESSCPISVGDFVIAHSQVLPAYTPPGSYSLKMKLYDGNNNELTCIKFGFDVGFFSSVADI